MGKTRRARRAAPRLSSLDATVQHPRATFRDGCPLGFLGRSGLRLQRLAPRRQHPAALHGARHRGTPLRDCPNGSVLARMRQPPREILYMESVQKWRHLEKYVWRGWGDTLRHISLHVSQLNISVPQLPPAIHTQQPQFATDRNSRTEVWLLLLPSTWPGLKIPYLECKGLL